MKDSIEDMLKRGLIQFGQGSFPDLNLLLRLTCPLTDCWPRPRNRWNWN